MELLQLLPFVAIALLFWLMVVRPASRRQKELARLQESLRPGQQVMLASGMFGTVRSLTDERARIELAPGVEVEVVRAAVNRVVDDTLADGSTDAGSSGSAGEQP